MTKLPEAISYLKIRGGYAETGNSTDPELINRTYSLGSLPGSVSNPNIIPDQDLKSEKTQAIELGMDIRFFDNRLNFDVDVYNYTTTDQILQARISEASGTSIRLFNAGEIQSSGLEVLLTAKPIVSDNFKWKSMFNFATSKSEVKSLAEGVETLIISQGPSGATIEARIGGQMGDIYGRGFARDPEGNIIYDRVDAYGTEIVRPRLDTEIKKQGNYNPDWTLGFTNNFKYKNLTLNVFLDYRHGGDFFSNTASQLYRSGSITETLEFREVDTTPVGVLQNTDGSFTTNTISTPGYDFYREYYGNITNIEVNTYDATFLKLREISLGIDLTRYFGSEFFNKIDLSIFGRNLATWTKTDFVRHFDPEVLSFNGSSQVPGFEVGQLPGAATYGFNLNLSF